jgi:hypothetical protein
MVTIPAAKRVRAEDIAKALELEGPSAALKYFSFEIPGGYKDALFQLFKRAKEKHGNYLHIVLGTPKRPRTLRQNSAAWGWCTDISEQLLLSGEYDGYSLDAVKDRVYDAMKRVAVNEVGWPTRISPIDGQIEPESQSMVSVEQDNGLLSVIKKFSDENGMWLTEMIDDKPVKCIGGKPIVR